ncbi:MAG: TIGR01777 family oxidoreductase [Myxococcota bacterium]
MHVAVTGGTGLIGRAVVAALRARGDRVTVLSRRSSADDDVMTWDASRGVAGVRNLEGLDAVINLAGAPLATRPWTANRREVLLNSRVDATAAIARSLAKLDDGPSVWVGIGTLGRFGDRGDDWVTEQDAPGEGFLADLGVQWEAAHQDAADLLGARCATLRLSIVLSEDGGAFPPMLVPFRYGFGGWLGDGQQYTPWMSRRDVANALLHLLDHELHGPFNGSVPEPIRNRAWFEALGRALGRPVRTHAPSWALRGALGDLGTAIFLSSCRVAPTRLLETGFVFQDDDPEAAFRRLLALSSE